MKINDRNIQQFLGQRSAVDPGSLYVKNGVSAAQINSYLLNKGRNGLDGKTGIGANLCAAGLGGYGLRQKEWIASDGNTYELFYLRTAAGSCSVGYYVNGARTAAPTALTYTDVAGSALTPVVPTQTLPTWGVYGGCLYLAMGQPGIFRITTKNGALSAQLTTAPASSKMVIVGDRMWVSVGDEPIIRWSALGDIERFTPKLAEMETNPPTYGIDYRVTLQSQGVSGNIIDCLAFGKTSLWWTQNECFLIYGDGDPGSTVFEKVGSGMGSNGQAIVYEGDVYWPSKYKGGSLRGFTFGSPSRGAEDVQVQDEKNIRFATFEAGAHIADVYQAMQQTTMQNAVVSWDTRSDWEAIPSAQRSGLSTTYEPGNILIQTRDNNITTTPAINLSNLRWALSSGDDTYLYDSIPLYPSTTVPDPTGKYAQYTYGGSSDTIVDEVSVHAYNASGSPLWVSSKQCTPYQGAWLSFDSLQIENVSRIVVKFNGVNAVRGGIYEPLDFIFTLTNQMVSAIRIQVHTFDVANRTIVLNEIRIEGSSTTTATFYTEAPTATSKAVLTGLTANSAIDFGRFFASYVGTSYDGTGGVLFYIRAGNTPHVSLASGTGTVSGTTLTGDGDNFGTLGVNKGDIITIAGTEYIVATVGTTTLTTTTAPGDGSKAYSVVGGAKATWSDWTAVTANDLLTGYNLKSLLYFGTSNPVLTAAAGTVLYVQAYATLTITNGVSPKIDAMFFTAHKGSNLTFAPAGYYDDMVFHCILTNSSSTSPDCEIVKYLDGEFTVIPGKKVNSYVNKSSGDCNVCEGYALGKQFDGTHNYTGADHTTETALLRQWVGPEETGDLRGGKLEVSVGSFVEDITDTLDWTPVAEANQINGQVYPDWYLYPFDRNIMHYGKDGYIYLLLPEPTDDTTPRLLLRKMTTAGAVESTTVVENRATDSPYYGACMVPDKTGDNLDIVWQRYASATTWDIATAKYNLSAGTLSTAVIVLQTNATKYIYPSVIRTQNDVLYVSFAKLHATDTILVYKSIDDGATFTSVTTITPTASADNNYATCLIEHKSKIYLFYQLMGYTGSVQSPIYFREITDDVVQSEQTARNTTKTFYPSSVISSGEELYLLAANVADTGDGEGVEILQLINGVFEKVSEVHDGGDTRAISLGNGYIGILNNEGSGVDTYYYWTTGKGTEWTTPELIETSGGYPSTVYGICRNDNNVYIWCYYLVDTVGGRIGTITYEIDSAKPLNIFINTNHGTKYTYSSTDVISETTTLPKSRRMPELGKVQDLSVGIQAYGNASIGSVKYNFFEEN